MKNERRRRRRVDRSNTNERSSTHVTINQTKTIRPPPGLADDRSGKCQAAEALPIPSDELSTLGSDVCELIRAPSTCWPMTASAVLSWTCLYTSCHEPSRQTVFPTVRKQCPFRTDHKSCRHIRRACRFSPGVATSVAGKLVSVPKIHLLAHVKCCTGLNPFLYLSLQVK